MQSSERDLQSRRRENADLQQQLQSSEREREAVRQQLTRKEAELTRAEETIRREQQQIQHLRRQVCMYLGCEGTPSYLLTMCMFT